MRLLNKFFARSAVVVATELIGCFLCRKLKDSKIQRLKIVEIEAYEGWNDKASHASRGKTARNAPMFEEAGTIYVYFTYGMHWMLNIVCGPKNYPSAILIRSLENVYGPARLTKYLGIDKSLNNQKLGKSSGLWIEKNENYTKIHGRGKVNKLSRVGVAYAGPIWSQKKWRFVLKEI